MSVPSKAALALAERIVRAQHEHPFGPESGGRLEDGVWHAWITEAPVRDEIAVTAAAIDADPEVRALVEALRVLIESNRRWDSSVTVSYLDEARAALRDWTLEK